MAIRSKSQSACVERYMAAHYDRVYVRWPKDFAASVRAQAEAQGQSIAGYLRQAVEERMTRDGVELPTKKEAKKEETEEAKP